MGLQLENESDFQKLVDSSGVGMTIVTGGEEQNIKAMVFGLSADEASLLTSNRISSKDFGVYVGVDFKIDSKSEIALDGKKYVLAPAGIKPYILENRVLFNRIFLREVDK
jgi:hypothetical protein